MTKIVPASRLVSKVSLEPSSELATIDRSLAVIRAGFVVAD
jgi:hypothetical protein